MAVNRNVNNRYEHHQLSTNWTISLAPTELHNVLCTMECMFPEFLDGLDVTRVTQFFFDVSAETGLNHLSDLQHQYLSD